MEFGRLQALPKGRDIDPLHSEYFSFMSLPTPPEVIRSRVYVWWGPMSRYGQDVIFLCREAEDQEDNHDGIESCGRGYYLWSVFHFLELDSSPVLPNTLRIVSKITQHLREPITFLTFHTKYRDGEMRFHVDFSEREGATYQGRCVGLHLETLLVACSIIPQIHQHNNSFSFVSIGFDAETDPELRLLWSKERYGAQFSFVLKYCEEPEKLTRQILTNVLETEHGSQPQTVDISWVTGVPKEQIPTVMSVISQYTSLRHLSLNLLTVSLNHLFGGEDHPGFPSLQKLDLVITHLDALREAVKNELSQLQQIALIKNVLTCLFKLLYGKDHPGFESLQILDLLDTELDAADDDALCEAVKQNKLPQLQQIDLSQNVLTGQLKLLFGGEDHPGFPSQQKLDLAITVLDAADADALGEAMKQNKLPQLQQIDLRLYVLTWQLKHRFGGEDHPGFESLQILDLLDTKLDAADVDALGEAVK